MASLRAVPSGADAALALGSEWFERLRDYGTRTEALREWDALRRERDGEAIPAEEDSEEYFAAANASIRVLRCPQPEHPGAWLVWWIHDFTARSMTVRAGTTTRW